MTSALPPSPLLTDRQEDGEAPDFSRLAAWDRRAPLRCSGAKTTRRPRRPRVVEKARLARTDEAVLVHGGAVASRGRPRDATAPAGARGDASPADCTAVTGSGRSAGVCQPITPPPASSTVAAPIAPAPLGICRRGVQETAPRSPGTSWSPGTRARPTARAAPPFDRAEIRGAGSVSAVTGPLAESPRRSRRG
ncbi:hypothetical protein SSP531S_38020 [Streptomyces spongiicola]|uniref:Uncharacterized protein n=1 Tax=Streptomyces spongiicola TaxID=1690221 RepID=A0A388T094_9ACTN|nr:hypothetical protein SSP531S_38020 [Streptomyces spongiicola]